jgi:hypothetical protein
MVEIHLSLLRGICQLPAYVAHANGFFLEQGLVAHVGICPSAWLISEQLCSRAANFGVMPWTRVAAVEKNEAPLNVVCGSGLENGRSGRNWALFIGVHVDVVRRALRVNRRDVDAIRNETAIKQVLMFMQKLGYVQHLPQNFRRAVFPGSRATDNSEPLVSDIQFAPRRRRQNEQGEKIETRVSWL